MGAVSKIDSHGIHMGIPSHQYPLYNQYIWLTALLMGYTSLYPPVSWNMAVQWIEMDHSPSEWSTSMAGRWSPLEIVSPGICFFPLCRSAKYQSISKIPISSKCWSDNQGKKHNKSQFQEENNQTNTQNHMAMGTLARGYSKQHSCYCSHGWSSLQTCHEHGHDWGLGSQFSDPDHNLTPKKGNTLWTSYDCRSQILYIGYIYIYIV